MSSNRGLQIVSMAVLLFWVAMGVIVGYRYAGEKALFEVQEAGRERDEMAFIAETLAEELEIVDDFVLGGCKE